MGIPYIGARREIAFTKEAVRGVGETYGAGDFVPHLGFDVAPVVENVAYDPSMGRIEENSDSFVVRKSSEGTVPLSLTNEFAGDILNMIFGKTPVTTGGDPYTHNWTLENTNHHLTYTITVKDPIKGFVKYPLSALSEATIEFVSDNLAKVGLKFMGGAEASATPGATTYSVTDTFFLPKHVEVKFADTFAGLSGGSVKTIETFTITFSKNVVLEWALGSEEPVDAINQKFGVGVALTMTYEDTELRDWAHAGTRKAMQVKVDNGDEALTFSFPKVAFKEWKPTSDDKAYLKNSVAIFGIRDATDGLVKATLENHVASY